jgi:hypothetical protein
MRAAARALLAGSRGRRAVDEQACAAFGASPGEVAGPAHEDAAVCELWPETVGALRLFEAMMSQWRVSGMGAPTGLDYAAIPATARLLGLERGALRRAFEGLRVMEAEALAWFAEQAA